MAEKLEPNCVQHSPEWGLPPKAEKWPTEAELREVAAKQEDPSVTLRRIRQRVPWIGYRIRLK